MRGREKKKGKGGKKPHRKKEEGKKKKGEGKRTGRRTRSIHAWPAPFPRSPRKPRPARGKKGKEEEKEKEKKGPEEKISILSFGNFVGLGFEVGRGGEEKKKKKRRGREKSKLLPLLAVGRGGKAAHPA